MGLIDISLYYSDTMILMERFFGNPLFLYLALYAATDSLIGIIRKVQYSKFGVVYAVTGSHAVKLGLLSVSISLLLVLNYFLYSNSLDRDYNSLTFFSFFAVLLGVISYFVMYLLDKKVKYSRKLDSKVLFNLYLFPTIVLLLAFFGLFKTLY